MFLLSTTSTNSPKQDNEVALPKVYQQHTHITTSSSRCRRLSLGTKLLLGGWSCAALPVRSLLFEIFNPIHDEQHIASSQLLRHYSPLRLPGEDGLTSRDYSPLLAKDDEVKTRSRGEIRSYDLYNSASSCPEGDIPRKTYGVSVHCALTTIRFFSNATLASFFAIL
jgi:hypothetical protein